MHLLWMPLYIVGLAGGMSLGIMRRIVGGHYSGYHEVKGPGNKRVVLAVTPKPKTRTLKVLDRILISGVGITKALL